MILLNDSSEARRCGGFTTMGETAVRRQILPGCLRVINHKEAKVRSILTREITTMRIYGPNGTTLGSPASNTRRTSSTGFSLPEAPAAPEEPRSAAAPKAAGNIDALLALQGVEDPTERRKRSVRGAGARSTCSTSSRSGCSPAISMLPR